MLKALTISQPYATLITSGEKLVENRTWSTDFRGPLAIHAGMTSKYLDRSELKDYPTGCIVGMATLIGCVTSKRIQAGKAEHLMTGLQDHAHVEGPWCLILKDIKELKDPIPCKGALYFWNVPEDVEKKILEAIRDPSSSA